MSNECDVILAEVPNDKEISIVKIVYRLLDINAKDAKNIVKSVPVALMQGASNEQAKTLQRELEQAGAKVNIQKTANFKNQKISQPLNTCDLDTIALEQYYLALSQVESKYQELLEMQKEFRWYESKLQEADELATQLELKKPSNLSFEISKSSNRPNRGVVESAITNARNNVTEHKNIQKQLKETISRLQQQFNERMSLLRRQGDETISNLQKEFNERMSRLRTQRDETISNLQNEINLNISNLQYQLENLDNQISSNLRMLENLKNKRMIEIILIILAGIATALVVPNIILVIISMLTIWGVRIYMG